jgi:hypothetical protein
MGAGESMTSAMRSALCGFVERNEIRAQIPAGRSARVSRLPTENLEKGGRIDRLLVHLVAAAHIVLQLEAVLGVHRVALLVDPLRCKVGQMKNWENRSSPASKKPLSMSKKKLVNSVPVRRCCCPRGGS